MSKKTVRMGKSGRIVIPAEHRRSIRAEDGDELVVRVVDDEIRITSLAAAIARAQRAVRKYVPEGHALSDELVAQRRGESERE